MWERKIPLYNGVSSESIVSLARHGRRGFTSACIERERERISSSSLQFVHVHPPPSSIKLVIVVGGGNNMICSPPLTQGFANKLVCYVSVQNKTKSFFCASFGPKCTKETRGVSHCDLANLH